MTYYTYIVKCSDKSFYTGSTDDLKERLMEHNGRLKGGAVYTRTRRPVVLEHFETFKTRSEAMKREYEIKKMSRAEKEAICKNGNGII